MNIRSGLELEDIESCDWKYVMGQMPKHTDINILQVIFSIKVVAMCWIQSICFRKPMYAEGNTQIWRWKTDNNCCWLQYSTISVYTVPYGMKYTASRNCLENKRKQFIWIEIKRAYKLCIKIMSSVIYLDWMIDYLRRVIYSAGKNRKTSKHELYITSTTNCDRRRTRRRKIRVCCKV